MVVRKITEKKTVLWKTGAWGRSRVVVRKALSNDKGQTH